MTKGNMKRLRIYTHFRPFAQLLKRTRLTTVHHNHTGEEAIAMWTRALEQQWLKCYTLVKGRFEQMAVAMVGSVSKVVDRLHETKLFLESMGTDIRRKNWRTFTHSVMDDKIKICNIRKCVRCMKGEDKEHAATFRRQFIRVCDKFLQYAKCFASCICLVDILN